MLLPWTCQSKKTQKCEQKMLDNFALTYERNYMLWNVWYMFRIQEMFNGPTYISCDVSEICSSSKKCSMAMCTRAATLSLNLKIAFICSSRKRQKTLSVVFKLHLEFHLCILIFNVFFISIFIFAHFYLFLHCIVSRGNLVWMENVFLSFSPKHGKISLKERSH